MLRSRNGTFNSWLSDVRSNTSPPPGCPLHNAGRNSQPNLQQNYRFKSSSVATASIEDVDMTSSDASHSTVKPFSEIPIPGKNDVLWLLVRAVYFTGLHGSLQKIRQIIKQEKSFLWFWRWFLIKFLLNHIKDVYFHILKKDCWSFAGQRESIESNIARSKKPGCLLRSDWCPIN